MSDTNELRAVKLTKAQAYALVDLSELRQPWLPASRSVKMVCRALERKGFASYQYGYPIGFSITPAGRAALLSTADARAPSIEEGNTHG